MSEMYLLSGENIQISKANAQLSYQQLMVHHVPKINNGAQINLSDPRMFAWQGNHMQHTTLQGQTHTFRNVDELIAFCNAAPEFDVVGRWTSWKYTGLAYLLRQVETVGTVMPQRLEVTSAMDAEMPIWDDVALKYGEDTLNPHDAAIYPGQIFWVSDGKERNAGITAPWDFDWWLQKQVGVPVFGLNLAPDFAGPGQHRVRWKTLAKHDQKLPEEVSYSPLSYSAEIEGHIYGNRVLVEGHNNPDSRKFTM